MTLSVEQRIAVLEQEVAALMAQRAAGASKKDWRRTIGMYSDNPGVLPRR
jgi:hypothetical protein